VTGHPSSVRRPPISLGERGPGSAQEDERTMGNQLHTDDEGRGATHVVVNVLLALAGLALILWILTLAGYDPIGWVEATFREWFG